MLQQCNQQYQLKWRQQQKQLRQQQHNISISSDCSEDDDKATLKKRNNDTNIQTADASPFTTNATTAAEIDTGAATAATTATILVIIAVPEVATTKPNIFN